MNTSRSLPRLVGPIRHRLEQALAHLLWPDGSTNDDFLRPHGEPALIDPDSTSWTVFKNPLALFIGGVTAVVLELAEPRVGAGVWQHTFFRQRPLERLRRTGHAAMLTVYGPRSRAESMIAGVARMHAVVRGVASDGQAFRASDPELIGWVHATASFGFLQAYHTYVRPLSALQRGRFYAEGEPVARLYGAASAPDSEAALDALFDSMGRKLERSDTVFEFLRIVRRMPALPAALRPVQDVLVRAAVQLIPAPLRERIGLDDACRLARWQSALVCHAGRTADRMILRTNPAVQACWRLGLPDDHLYSRRPHG